MNLACGDQAVPNPAPVSILVLVDNWSVIASRNHSN